MWGVRCSCVDPSLHLFHGTRPSRSSVIRALAQSRGVRLVLVIWVCTIVGLSPAWGAERIRTLLIGWATGSSDLEVLFKEEPLVDLASVPCREGVVPGDLSVQMKYIRQYFPRTYGEMGGFDCIMLITTSYDLLSGRQDQWIHDRIAEGAGGLNDQSVLAIFSQVYTAWANSIAQNAFPNDAPAVVAWGRGGDYTASPYYGVVIDRDFPDPVLTPYIPFGVEQYRGYVSRYVVPRQGAGIMAYQTGSFIGYDRVPFLVAWDYGKGKTITCGGALHVEDSWFGGDNLYGPDMFINMVLYLTHRDLIEDVEVFHRIKGNFHDFRNRLELLISLVDFIEKFGANTKRVYDQINDLRDMGQIATEKYLEQDFRGSEEVMHEASDRFVEVESLAKEVKNSALLWVYVTEWCATTAAFFTSGFFVWTLMVRRRMYRAVATTRMK